MPQNELWHNFEFAISHDDVLVQQEPVVVPLGEEVAGDLHRVLDVVDLADVEAVEA